MKMLRYYPQFYAHKYENVDAMDKFLENIQYPRTKHEKMEIHNMVP